MDWMVMEGVGDLTLNHLKAVQARLIKGSLFIEDIQWAKLSIQGRETNTSPHGFKNAALYQFGKKAAQGYFPRENVGVIFGPSQRTKDPMRLIPN